MPEGVDTETVLDMARAAGVHWSEVLRILRESGD